MARHERPAAILSSFPPTASHVVALALHRATRLPWVVDFRDPWASGAEHGYVWASAGRVTAQAEATVLRRATALTTIGPSLGAELAQRASREVVVLPHGVFTSQPPAACPCTGSTTPELATSTAAALGTARAAGRGTVGGGAVVVVEVDVDVLLVVDVVGRGAADGLPLHAATTRSTRGTNRRMSPG